MLICLLDYVAESLLHHQRFATLNHSPLAISQTVWQPVIFDTRALELFVVFATSVFAQGRSLEQSEVQITVCASSLFPSPLSVLC